MVTKFEVVGKFDGNDREFYEQLAEDYEQYGWTVTDCEAECKFGVMTVDELTALFGSWGDELDDSEREEVKGMLFGQVIEINRGRGSLYEIVRVE
jgi:hypothetical protein